MYKSTGEHQYCLECGTEILYGRSDKKYCCDDCRVRSHNRDRAEHKNVRSTVIHSIDRNYRILESLMKQEVDSIGIPELRVMGFDENCVTSWGKWRNHNMYMCYDIKYFLTPVRIFGISKITVPGFRQR